MLICHLYIFLGEVCGRIFFNKVVYLVIVALYEFLCGFNKNSLSGVFLANTFCEAVACLFIFWHCLAQS